MDSSVGSLVAFLSLTSFGDGTPVYVRASRVVGVFMQKEQKGSVALSVTAVWVDGVEKPAAVRETPERIFEMLHAAAKAGAL